MVKKPLMDDAELQPKKGKKAKAIISDDLEQELGKTKVSNETLKQVSTLAYKAGDLTEKIEGLEEMLKGHRDELHNLTTRQLPDAMREAGSSLFKTDDGTLKVELKDFLNGSLPKDEEGRAKAMKWLEANGAASLIKTQFNVALGRGQKSDAKKVQQALGKLGITYTEKEDVHAQSLYSYVRERMKAAQEVPLEMLGLYSGTVAKIELIKK